MTPPGTCSLVPDFVCEGTSTPRTISVCAALECAPRGCAHTRLLAPDLHLPASPVIPIRFRGFCISLEEPCPPPPTPAAASLLPVLHLLSAHFPSVASRPACLSFPRFLKGLPVRPVPLSDELKAALDVDPTPGGVKYIIATQVRPSGPTD